MIRLVGPLGVNLVSVLLLVTFPMRRVFNPLRIHIPSRLLVHLAGLVGASLHLLVGQLAALLLVKEAGDCKEGS